jgi:hypothetical protein
MEDDESQIIMIKRWMMANIENPKVFISYAWTNEEYAQRVVDFSKRLIGDGVEVLLDKFEMTPGKELNDFMEKCVKDKTVTNVIILLNPAYAQRADNRQGGVGKETQIISEEVYNDVGQTKFVPVIFDVEDGDFSKSKPIFLKSRIHINLSENESYARNYMNLIRNLYGKLEYQKPKKGEKPSWVDHEPEVTGVTYNIKEYIRKGNYKDLPERLIDDSLDAIIQLMLSDEIFINKDSWQVDKIYETYQYLTVYRNDFIELVNTTCEIDGVSSKYIRFFEMLKDQGANYVNNDQIKNDYLRTLAHELVIYCIAIFLRKDKFKLINELVYTPYFNDGYRTEDGLFGFRQYFYTNNNFDIRIKSFLDTKDQKNYYSGKAHAWINNLYEPVVNKEEFVDADVLLTSLTILCETKDNHPWFAVTYVYSKYRQSKIKKIAMALESKRLASKYFDLFNSSSIQTLKSQLQKIKDFDSKRTSHFGYDSAFDSIEFITNYIDIDKIGTII